MESMSWEGGRFFWIVQRVADSQDKCPQFEPAPEFLCMQCFMQVSSGFPGFLPASKSIHVDELVSHLGCIPPRPRCSRDGFWIHRNPK